MTHHSTSRLRLTASLQTMLPLLINKILLEATRRSRVADWSHMFINTLFLSFYDALTTLFPLLINILECFTTSTNTFTYYLLKTNTNINYQQQDVYTINPYLIRIIILFYTILWSRNNFFRCIVGLIQKK